VPPFHLSSDLLRSYFFQVCPGPLTLPLTIDSSRPSLSQHFCVHQILSAGFPLFHCNINPTNATKSTSSICTCSSPSSALRCSLHMQSLRAPLLSPLFRPRYQLVRATLWSGRVVIPHRYAPGTVAADAQVANDHAAGHHYPPTR
jgi:hypothetical protein